MTSNESNRPLRVFEKVIKGGLGSGNIGVIAARHGTGKVAVLMSIAVDKALNSNNVLQVTTIKSVDEVRTFRDEVLHEMELSLDLHDRGGLQTLVERHTRIHTYKAGSFSVDRLRTTLTFAREHAEFTPSLLEIEGWPDFDEVTLDQLRELKVLAEEFQCEVWLSDHTHRDDSLDKATGLPTNLARFDSLLSVVIKLEPEARTVPLRFLKAHGKPVSNSINLEFDPKTMLLRWR